MAKLTPEERAIAEYAMDRALTEGRKQGAAEERARIVALARVTADELLSHGQGASCAALRKFADHLAKHDG